MGALIDPLITPVPGAVTAKMTPRAAERYVRGIVDRVQLTGKGCKVQDVVPGQVTMEALPWAADYHVSDFFAANIRDPFPNWGTSGPVHPFVGVGMNAPPGLATCAWARREITHVARSLALDGLGIAAQGNGSVVVQRDQSHIRHPWRVSINNGIVRVRPGPLGVAVLGSVVPLMGDVPNIEGNDASLYVGPNFTGWIALLTYWSGGDPTNGAAWEIVGTTGLTPKGDGGVAHVPFAYIVGGQVAVQMTRSTLGIGVSPGGRVEADWGW